MWNYEEGDLVYVSMPAVVVKRSSTGERVLVYLYTLDMKIVVFDGDPFFEIKPRKRTDDSGKTCRT